MAKEYEINFQLAAQMAASFQKTMGRATETIEKLQDEVKSIQKVKAPDMDFDNVARGAKEASGNVGLLRNSVKGLATVAGGLLAFEGVKNVFGGALSGAAELEQQKIQLQALVGNAEKAQKLFDDMNAKGMSSAFSESDFLEGAKAFLPITKNLEQINELVAIQERLASSNPLEGMEGAAFSIREALSGDTVSLAERFNVPKSMLKSLKSATDMTGRIKALDDIMNTMGYTTEYVSQVNQSSASQWDNLKSNVQMAISKSGSAALELLKGPLTQINNWIGKGGLQILTSTISKTMAGTVKALLWGVNMIGKVGKGISKLFSQMFGNINFGDVAGKIKEVFGNVVNVVTSLFSGNGLEGAGQNLFKSLGLEGPAVDALVANLMNIRKVVSTIFNGISGVIKKAIPVNKSVVKSFATGAQAIINALMPIYTYLMSKIYPIFSMVFNYITGTLIPQLLAAFQKIAPMIASVAVKAGAAITAMYNFIKPVIDALVVAFNYAFPLIKSVVSGAITMITGVIKGLMTTLGGILDFITGVFTGNWSLAWTGVVDTFGGIWSGLKALVATPINAVIRLVNKAITSINGISVDIPEWLGGGTLGFSIPTIPEIDAYAKGGIASKPSIFGEAGPEVAIPLNNKPRSHNLLNTANRIMGNTPVGGGDFVYSPNFIIQGNADQQAIEQMDKQNQMSFKDQFNQYKRQQNRVRYAQ